jgi:hypothetical protein
MIFFTKCIEITFKKYSYLDFKTISLFQYQYRYRGTGGTLAMARYLQYGIFFVCYSLHFDLFFFFQIRVCTPNVDPGPGIKGMHSRIRNQDLSKQIIYYILFIQTTQSL